MTLRDALAAALHTHFDTGRHGWSLDSCATAVVMDPVFRAALVEAVAEALHDDCAEGARRIGKPTQHEAADHRKHGERVVARMLPSGSQSPTGEEADR